MYDSAMTDKPSEYRVSKNALIISGSIAIAVGLLVVAWAWLVGAVIAVAGVALLVSGLVRPSGASSPQETTRPQ